ncbi:hypothetical protein [Stakelama pacifica]|uniref:Uncharacterized protein n=1 Tax=Stakelama pacifica TaxID=517720 RepID=A0A4R6FM68_9SPHN|nr:hypothetical protein [Stakelama pacifica]TDN81744.1 hypothetical protein EV664_107146 [Stakelama pacifica]GGO96439.1 hypothetical protein GCM10011329_22970 [Stakelama pacifica]
MAKTLSEQFDTLCKKHDLSAIGFSCHAPDRGYDKPYYFVTLTWGDIGDNAHQNCSGTAYTIDEAFKDALAQMTQRRNPSSVDTGIEDTTIEAEAA